MPTLWPISYQIVELTAPIVEQTKSLLEHHQLRAYDAVQLASALLAQDVLRSAGLPPLILLSADDRLNAAASAEGLAVDNPNDHP
jgi:uncharacterized protein